MKHEHVFIVNKKWFSVIVLKVSLSISLPKKLSLWIMIFFAIIYHLVWKILINFRFVYLFISHIYIQSTSFKRDYDILKLVIKLPSSAFKKNYSFTVYKKKRTNYYASLCKIKIHLICIEIEHRCIFSMH